LCVVRSRRILSLALWRVLLLAVGSLLAIGSLLVAVIVVVRHGVCTSGIDVKVHKCSDIDGERKRNTRDGQMGDYIPCHDRHSLISKCGAVLTYVL
jgi:hypothetical protein